ncbi:translation initiation factor IF-3 [Stappia sp.]|uniref:translation initiation factor IF-3 n=1 Tax=Stappia sp. TaxID=1870903 RepID=UPI0032D8B602
MIDAGAVLAQTIRIVVGLIAAFLAAGIFLAFGLFQALDPQSDPVGFGATVGTGLVSASVIGGVTFVPALIAVCATEIFRLRGITVHLAAAGLIAVGVWSAGDAQSVAPGSGGLAPGSVVAAAAGFVAGFVYWLIAGRQAGGWRRSRDAGAPLEDRDATARTGAHGNDTPPSSGAR